MNLVQLFIQRRIATTLLALGLGIVVAGWGVVARFGLHSMGGFDAAMTAQLQEAIRRSTTPIPAEMTGFVNSPEFRAGAMLAVFAMGSACLLLMSAVGGAFAGLGGGGRHGERVSLGWGEWFRARWG